MIYLTQLEWMMGSEVTLNKLLHHGNGLTGVQFRL